MTVDNRTLLALEKRVKVLERRHLHTIKMVTESEQEVLTIANRMADLQGACFLTDSGGRRTGVCSRDNVEKHYNGLETDMRNAIRGLIEARLTSRQEIR